MLLTERQLRGMINQALHERTMQGRRRLLRRLDELYAGSSVGSYLKQAITKLWEADNMVQRALAEVDTSEEHKLLTMIHKAIEQLAFNVDDKVENIMSGDVEKQRRAVASKKKAPPPTGRR